MDREQMKLAILKQEHTFRQQVQELHRLYHVQKQLMQQMQLAAASPATTNHHYVKKPKQEFQIVHGDNKPMNPGQVFGLSTSSTMAPAAASAADEYSCSLELTLATGPSSSSSGSAAAGTGGRTQQPGSKRLRSSSNSDSGTTAVSSTSTDSELALFGEVAGVTTEKAAAVRFQGEARRMDEMRHQGAWMYQCLSLRTA